MAHAAGFLVAKRPRREEEGKDVSCEGDCHKAAVLQCCFRSVGNLCVHAYNVYDNCAQKGFYLLQLCEHVDSFGSAFLHGEVYAFLRKMHHARRPDLFDGPDQSFTHAMIRMSGITPDWGVAWRYLIVSVRFRAGT